MSAKSSTEDAYYEQQIVELNCLGNALLSGVIGEKLAEKKEKIVNKVQMIADLQTYKTEVDKLKSLKIANIHKILTIKEENDKMTQIIAAEKLLVKIEQILDAHIKYNAKDVITKEELEQLKNHMNVVQSLKESFKDDIPNTANSKLKNVEEFAKDLNKIIEYIESTSAKLNESQIKYLNYAENAEY